MFFFLCVCVNHLSDLKLAEVLGDVSASVY